MRTAYVACALAAGFASAAAFADAPAMPSGGMLVAANGMTLYTGKRSSCGAGGIFCSG